MMRAILLALCLAGAGGGVHAAAAGTPAPSFELAGRSAPVSLAAYRGKLVYLDFWASWCGPCKRSFPFMSELQKRYGDAGLRVVAINVDAKRTDADDFLAQTPAGFDVAFDPAGATAKLYAIKGMPSSVLITPEGQVLHVHAGFNDDTARRIEGEIRQALRLPAK